MGVNPHRVVTADFEASKSVGDTAFKRYDEESAFLSDTISLCRRLDTQYESSHPGETLSREFEDIEHRYESLVNYGFGRLRDYDGDIRRVLGSWLENDKLGEVSMQTDEVKERLRHLLTEGMGFSSRLSEDHGAFGLRAQQSASLVEEIYMGKQPEIVRSMGEMRSFVCNPTITHSLTELDACYNVTRDHLWLLQVQRTDGSSGGTDLSDNDSWQCVKHVAEISFNTDAEQNAVDLINEMVACGGGVRLIELFSQFDKKKLQELGDLLKNEVGLLVPKFREAQRAETEFVMQFGRKHGVAIGGAPIRVSGEPEHPGESFGDDCETFITLVGEYGKVMHQIADAFDDATNIDYAYFGTFRRDSPALDQWITDMADRLHICASAFGGNAR